MSARVRGFVLGFAAAAALFTCGAFVWDGLRDGMIRSKSKRFLDEGSIISEAIVSYRAQRSEYPPSKAAVLESLARADGDFDYFTDPEGYTLVCPSLTGRSRWDPYVFHNGRLVAWPRYMDDVVKQPSAPPNSTRS